MCNLLHFLRFHRTIRKKNRKLIALIFFLGETVNDIKSHLSYLKCCCGYSLDIWIIVKLRSHEINDELEKIIPFTSRRIFIQTQSGKRVILFDLTEQTPYVVL